jgi:type II secretory pathway component GspD/PulD (secretin)
MFSPPPPLGCRVTRILNFVRRLFARVGPALLPAIIVAAIMVPVARTAGPADDPVTLNFVNADIEAVVRAVSEITGRNFIVDPKVKGTINIISARPVPKSLVYPTLVSALRLQGFAVVEGNGVVKIVPRPMPSNRVFRSSSDR